MTKRALLLVNRYSRQGRLNADRAAVALRRGGLVVIEQSAEHAGSLADVVRRYRDQIDLAVVGGGDGTLNAAVDGIVEADVPLGILPLGTANDLARTLNLPTDLDAACRVIAAGHTRRIDLGQVNDKYFFNVASIGLSVQVTRRLARQGKGRWGPLAYAATAFGAVWKARPFHAEIRTADGEVIESKTLQIAVGNGVYYGGGNAIAQDAAIDDRRLDLYSLEVTRRWEIFVLLPALRRGSLEPWSQARTLHGPSFEVTTRQRRAVNTDGELTTRTPALFRVVPGALSVFVPEGERPA